MSEINPYRINTDAMTVAVNSHPELAPHCQRFAMEFWEFLIQKEGDRSWLPLESPRVEILEGRYRVVARTSRVNTPVEIRIAHVAIAEDPPKRRVQKRVAQTNREGLIVVIPFTRLLPGIWELRCTGDLMSDMMGQGWGNTVQLQVTTHEIATHGDWEPDWQHGIEPTASVTPAPFQVQSHEAQVWPFVETAPLGLASDAATEPSTLEPSVPEEASAPTSSESHETVGAESDRPISSDTEPTGVEDLPGMPVAEVPPTPVSIALLDCHLVLAQEAYVVEHDQPLVLQGYLNSAATEVIDATEAELIVCLRDPQTAQAVMERGYVIAIPSLPCPIQVSVTVPHDATRVLLGELVVQILSPLGEVTRLASQSFTVAVAVGELLEAIAEPDGADPVYAPLEFLQPEDTSLNLEFLELLDAPRQTVQFQPVKKGTLPPQIYSGSSSSTTQKKTLDLPFSNPSRSVLGVSPELDSAIREAIASTPSLSAAVSPDVSPASAAPLDTVPPDVPNLEETTSPSPVESLNAPAPVAPLLPLEVVQYAAPDDTIEHDPLEDLEYSTALDDAIARFDSEELAELFASVELESPIAAHDDVLEETSEPFSLDPMVAERSSADRVEPLPIHPEADSELDDDDIGAFVDQVLDGPDLPWDEGRSPVTDTELAEEPWAGEVERPIQAQLSTVNDLSAPEPESPIQLHDLALDDLSAVGPELQSPISGFDELPDPEPEISQLPVSVVDELPEVEPNSIPVPPPVLDAPLDTDPDIPLQTPIGQLQVEPNPKPQVPVLDNPLEVASRSPRSTDDSGLVALPSVPPPMLAPVPPMPLSPEREAFQALNLRQRFWQRLSSMASNSELSGWLKQTSSPSPPLFNDPSLGIDSDLASHEFVVDFDLSSAEATGDASMSAVPVLPEDMPIPPPSLTVPEGELTAGRPVNITAQMPQVEPRIYIKLWVHDCETRSLLDGPKWLVNFVPTTDDQQTAWTSVMVPYGCLSIRFEAIAVEMATQRESSKVSVTREVVPPNLPDLSLDLPSDFDL